MLMLGGDKGGPNAPRPSRGSGARNQTCQPKFFTQDWTSTIFNFTLGGIADKQVATLDYSTGKGNHSQPVLRHIFKRKVFLQIMLRVALHSRLPLLSTCVSESSTNLRPPIGSVTPQKWYACISVCLQCSWMSSRPPEPPEGTRSLSPMHPLQNNVGLVLPTKALF